MLSFFQKLDSRVSSVHSLLCIGLDPHISQLPTPTPEAAAEFCKEIISQTHPFAAAFKPNSAFFESFGEAGFRCLKEVIECIPKDIPVILDIKRGDIDTTAQAYAAAAYDIFNVDCVTLNPYMGWNAIEPFISKQYSNKGAFVLCKTSNPSSKEVQELKLETGEYCYEKILHLCDNWNRHLSPHALGVVAGATDLIALQRIRAQSPDIWILCPGVGTQGGDANHVCEVGLRRDGSGLLVAVSRAISTASNMAIAAETLRNDINAHRTHYLLQQQKQAITTPSSNVLKAYQEEFIQLALANQSLQFGSFTLKSGRVSPYFFNAGKFCTGKSLHFLCRYYAQAVKETGLHFDVIFGPAYKGIPLVTGFAMAWYELFQEEKEIAYNRKEVKDHGEGGMIVGASLTSRHVLIIDDVITAGTAIREAVTIIEQAGGRIVGTVVCLDRQERVTAASTTSTIQEVEAAYGFPVISIIQLQHLIAYMVLNQQQAKQGRHNTSSNPDLAVTDPDDTAAAVEEQLRLIELYREQYGV